MRSTDRSLWRREVEEVLLNARGYFKVCRTVHASDFVSRNSKPYSDLFWSVTVRSADSYVVPVNDGYFVLKIKIEECGKKPVKIKPKLNGVSERLAAVLSRYGTLEETKRTDERDVYTLHDGFETSFKPTILEVIPGKAVLTMSPEGGLGATYPVGVAELVESLLLAFTPEMETQRTVAPTNPFNGIAEIAANYRRMGDKKPTEARLN